VLRPANETQIERAATDAGDAAVTLWEQAHLHLRTKHRRRSNVCLHADAIFARARQQIEQARDRGVASIRGHESRRSIRCVSGADHPAVFDRSHGGALPNLRSELRGARQQKFVEQTSPDRDFAAALDGERDSYGAPAKINEFNRFKPRVWQSEQTIAHVQSIKQRPAGRVETVAADFVARERRALE
jgi:hypothetical protein